MALTFLACVSAGCQPSQGAGASGDAAGGSSGGAPRGSSSDAPGGGGGARFDPLGGEYPQLSWMINVIEVDGPVGLARGGEVIPVDDPSRARPESIVFTREQERRVFDSVQGVRGYRLVSAPFVMSRPGQRAEIGVGSRDKAGQSTGSFATAVKGALDGESVKADIECLHGAGPTAARWQRADGAVIPGGGGVVITGPIEGRTSAGGRPIWGVVVVRPAILRSVDDYPFQTSTSFSSSN